MTKETRQRDRWDLLLRGGRYWCLSVPLMVVRRLRIRLCKLRNDLPLAGMEGLSYASVREIEVSGYGERKQIADGIWDVEK